MSQSQNPQEDAIFARINANPQGQDLIQVLNTAGGAGVVYRLNQFQAVWYAGTGNPGFIPGELIGNLYIDISTGNIWELNTSFVWVLLPSGGGGGGGSSAIGTQFTTTANNFDTVPLLGVLSSSFAVLSAVNGVAAAMIAAGQVEIAVGTNTVTVTHPPTAGAVFNIVTSASTGGTGLGVTELNGLTGNLTVAPGSGIGVGVSGTSVVITNDGVTSLNSLVGAMSLVAGANVTITPSGNNLIIASSGGGGGGVTSFNSLTGAIVLAPGVNTSFTTVGNTVTVNSTATSTPWADIQAYGAVPHKFAFNQPTAGATTVSGSPNVTIASGTLASALTNGQGVCIWKVGNATSQTTPNAPTITSPAVVGSQTITYQIVGFDALGGLTVASAAGTVTNAPAVFSPLPVTITSISASGGTVTANFNGPLNTTVSAGMTIHIVGVTGSGSSWNGIWTLASAPTNSQVTFSVSGASGTGTVGASSTGRLSNSQPITAISLAVNGIMTITTAQNHNYQVGTTFAPTEIIVENCTPPSLNGYYAILTASGTSITVATGLFGTAVTGSVTAGSSTATVWEHLVVACPQLATNTVGYYVYSDSPSPGGALTLIGKVPLGDCNFEDYGQCFLAGYGAPGYVPTTPPVAAQNQMFTSTIVSGGGTVNLVLANNVPTGISALGATLMYDDGPNLNAALTAASGNTAISGTVILTPPTTNSDFSGYIFNSPITVAQNVNVVFACEAIINETWIFEAFNQVSAIFGSSSIATPAFGTQNFCNVTGAANPFFFLGENTGNTGGITIDGLCFSAEVNGQIGIIDTCFYTRIANCGFKSNAAKAGQGNAMAIIYLGSSSLSEAENLNWALANRFYAAGTGVPGQSNLGPARLPAIWFRGSTNTALPNYNDNTAQFTFRGKHSANGRGITFDQQYSTANGNQGPCTIGAAIWMQQGTTPVVSVMGDIFYAFDLKNILNDTSIAASFANLGLNTHDVSITGSSSGSSQGSPASVVTGNPVINLSAAGNTAQLQTQFQRVGAVEFTSSSNVVDVINVPNSQDATTYSLDAMNASAQLDISAGLAYILYNFNGQVTVVHSATSGMNFAIRVTIGNT